MAPTYPDLSVQAVVAEPWWTQGKPSTGPLARGRLIWVTVPYPDMKPYRLIPVGRGTDPQQHQQAQYRIEEYRVSEPKLTGSVLPVAGLPTREDETYLVRRAKRRPAVVVALSGVEIRDEFKKGSSAWQHRPAVLVAPYYGSSADGTRAGWHPGFVARIQCGEYCQYAWDVLPMSDKESILRFDHVFPVGGDSANWQDTGFQMTGAAMTVLDEWFSWHLTGTLTDGVLHTARTLLLDSLA